MQSGAVTYSHLAEAAQRQLTGLVKGALYLPGTSEYERARQGFILTVDQHPALILVASGSPDIQAGLAFARRHGIGVAVQSTGHGTVRPADGALLILTNELNDVYINEGAQTAWVGAGARWGSVLEKAQAVGLAPLLGSSPNVGVMGYTLGGGMGWLARKYGLAIDSVNNFDLITADGRSLRASTRENAQLFWALRGGGGNFGVVTGMEIKLYPVTQVYGGNLFYPAEDAREVFARYREWVKTLPDEMTSAIVLMNFPPLPVVPEMLRGKSFVMVRGCYSGPIAGGEALIQTWRAWKQPLIDDFKAMPFSRVAEVSNDPTEPAPASMTGAWLGDLDGETAEVLLRYGLPHNGPLPLVVSEVRNAGGAIARPGNGAGAYGNRQAPFILYWVGMTPSPEAVDGFHQYTRQILDTLGPHLTGGVYMNFMDGRSAAQRVQDGFGPENYQRLRAVKTEYDPHNLFRFSFPLEG